MNNRGSMGGCNHTNDNFYGSNGCKACDEELEYWLEQQRKEREKYSSTNEEEDETEE